MKVAIIGAGPAGLTSAIKLAKKNNQVVVFERNNQALKKLKITGNGKCNLFKEEEFNVNKYHSSNIKILKKIITKSNVEMYKNFLKDIGIEVVIKNNYAYPVSEKAYSVASTLLNKVKELNIEIRYNARVENVQKINNKFIILNEEFDALVISCGGKSYPKLGSDGIGYDIAKSFKHTIKELNPSLTSLITNTNMESKWSGLRSKCIVSLGNLKEEGEVQFTSFGLSGICIFNLSRKVKEMLNKKEKVIIHLDLVPSISNLEEYLVKKQEKFKNRDIASLCDCLIDYKLTNILVAKYKIKNIKEYARLLKDFKVEVIDVKSYDTAQVTSGGVSLEEIDENTLESKLVSNLYFTGEILDIDGDCGGYNLTSCFTTALLVGGK